MGLPYSIDLRIELLNYSPSDQHKGNITKAAKIFNLNRNTIYNWLSLKKETGNLKGKTGYQKGYNHKIKDLSKFKEFVDSNPNKSSEELAILYTKAKMSKTTMLRWIHKLNYTYKKNIFLHKEG